MSKYLTAQQVAEKVGVSAETVREWYRGGKIPGTMLPGKDLRFEEERITKWLEGRTSKVRAHVG